MSTEDRDEPQPEEDGASSGGGAFSLWGLGASVLGKVQKNTSTFVNTIVETDWQKELQEIQDGLRSETAELEKDIGTKLGIAPAEKDTTDSSTTRAAPATAETDGVSIADIGRRFLTGTAEIFQQVRTRVDNEFANLEQEAAKKPRSSLPRAGREGGAKFSRLDMKISAMQRNSATYCDEPDDSAAFSEFLAEYDEEARATQAADILSTNPFMSELHSRLVPLVISDDTFWQRYFFRLQKLTQEFEKVQERLQQAHRRASKQELDPEPLDSLSGPLSKAEASPVTSPTTALDSVPAQFTPGETPEDDSEHLDPQASSVVLHEEEGDDELGDIIGVETSVLNQDDPLQAEARGDDARVEGSAERGAADDDNDPSGLNGSVPAEVVREDTSAERMQPSARVAAVAVGVVGGDGEEGGDSAGSSGNEKFSSDWSVVSPTNLTGNGTAGTPQEKVHQAEDAPTEAQEAAAKPAGAELSLATTPDCNTVDEGDPAEEEVDFDDLEDGEEGGEDGEEDGDGEDVDDNWGWE